jgi:hypothetical protein
MTLVSMRLRLLRGFEGPHNESLQNFGCDAHICFSRGSLVVRLLLCSKMRFVRFSLWPCKSVRWIGSLRRRCETPSLVNGGPWLTILELFRWARSSQGFHALEGSRSSDSNEKRGYPQ